MSAPHVIGGSDWEGALFKHAARPPVESGGVIVSRAPRTRASIVEEEWKRWEFFFSFPQSPAEARGGICKTPHYTLQLHPCTAHSRTPTRPFQYSPYWRLMEAVLTPRPEEIPEAGAVREAMVTRTKTPDRGPTTPSSPKGGTKNSGTGRNVKSSGLPLGTSSIRARP